ncbi:MAG: iron-sulfur cluster assembly accessory protein [Saprospiraceae bacterium]
MSTQTMQPVTITRARFEELKNIRAQQEYREDALRIGVKGSGGCSRFFLHTLVLMSKKKKIKPLKSSCSKFVMDKSHTHHLIGMEIDWVDGLDNKASPSINPNASDTCGCGTSLVHGIGSLVGSGSL